MEKLLHSQVPDHREFILCSLIIHVMRGSFLDSNLWLPNLHSSNSNRCAKTPLLLGIKNKKINIQWPVLLFSISIVNSFISFMSTKLIADTSLWHKIMQKQSVRFYAGCFWQHSEEGKVIYIGNTNFMYIVLSLFTPIFLCRFLRS